jgi:streptogramin lyase
MVRSITTSGLVLDVAGSGIEGYADGPRAEAQFSSPNAVTVGPEGTVYVADAANLRVRAISPAGVVTTLAGSGTAGYLDAAGEQAQFAIMGAVVADPAGNVYTSDRLNNVIRRISPGGLVSTYAGDGLRAHLDGMFQSAEFNVPTRMGADPLGNIYVLDTGDNSIRKMTPTGIVSTVAGGTGSGFADGPVSAARFSGDILGITADATGAVYVMDAGNHRIRVVSPDGIVSTVFEVTDPNQTPGNIKLDRAGAIYLSDREHNAVYRLPPPGPESR